MTQYRIEELAAASGINARNIRAYRERGLLDPPVRVGRAAIYGDTHLAQLRVIDQLLAKGFTSAHIAEFFTAVRAGHDLADLLGLQGVVAEEGSADAVDPVPFDVDLTRTELRGLLAAGLVTMSDGRLMLSDPDLVRIVARSPDRKRYLAVLVDVFASTQQGVNATAEDVDSLLDEAAAESAPALRDFRSLAAIVIARQIDEAVRKSLMRSTA
ncbi:MAG: transcriptional regulator, MerR family [Mycobacterium sp.]|nr:transcriptional regulator, MerR family [Mycobacterium sp.]